MRIQINNRVRFEDNVTRETITGFVLEVKPGTETQLPVALIKWDDGYRDS